MVATRSEEDTTVGRSSDRNAPLTFSIVGADPRNGELGVAVQSKFLAVGALVPWAEAGVGAVATQAFVDATIGPRGLELLRQGVEPSECVGLLTQEDDLREQRQFGLVRADGRAASFTGSECFDHASSSVGDGYAAQGNILAGPAVVEGLVAGFHHDPSEPLAVRLMRALDAAQAAGGDSRGQQSAALLVVRPGGGYGGNHDRMVDLRVDDHAAPIAELRRLYELHRFFFERPDPDAAVVVDDALRGELRSLLTRSGFAAPDDAELPLFAYLAAENLEERWVGADRIDPVVLGHLRRTAPGA